VIIVAPGINDRLRHDPTGTDGTVVRWHDGLRFTVLWDDGLTTVESVGDPDDQLIPLSGFCSSGPAELIRV
jgi:hypothetical protein